VVLKVIAFVAVQRRCQLAEYRRVQQVVAQSLVPDGRFEGAHGVR
jgi:hypothetical protein